MQLAEIEEMAQQADRMRINDKSSKSSRERRNSESGKKICLDESK